MKTIKKNKWFWAWQDEKEEAWLAEMSAEGLHLESLPFPGTYQFKEGEPGTYVYRLDFQALKSKDKDSYLQLFADAGWEHIGDMGGWVYFRHLVNGNEIPEIFSDLESKLGKYQRLLGYLIIFLPIMFILLPNVNDTMRYGPFMIVPVVLSAGLMVLYSLAMILIFRRMAQLRAKKE